MQRFTDTMSLLRKLVHAFLRAKNIPSSSITSLIEMLLNIFCHKRSPNRH